MANEQPAILVAVEDADARRKAIQKLDAALAPHRTIEAGSMWEAARQCERLSDIDFIILDNDLVERAGTRFLAGLSALQPSARLMVFGPPRARASAIKMLEAGASAYLPSDLAPADLAKAFDLVMSGAVFAPIAVATPDRDGAPTAMPRAVVVPFPGRKPISEQLPPTQREILSMLARGRSNAEIAFLLGQSESAVTSQVTALMGLIGLGEQAAPRVDPSGEGVEGSGSREPDEPPN